MKYLKTAWKNMRRSPYQAVAAIFVMMSTFFIFSLFALFFYVTSEAINFFESKPQVTAFFTEEATPEEINSLEKSLGESGIVSDTKFVSKDEALEIYKEQNKDEPLLLDLVTAEILPASLEISTYNVEDLTTVSETLRKASIVEEVVFQKDVIETLTSYTTIARIIFVGLFAFLASVSMIIIITIIGVKISQKRDDIETMRLIGASKWYVRAPLLLEGMLYGLIGSLIGWLVAAILLFALTPAAVDFTKGLGIFPIPPLVLLALLGVQIVLAILLGAFSSFVAVLRYLK